MKTLTLTLVTFTLLACSKPEDPAAEAPPADNAAPAVAASEADPAPAEAAPGGAADDGEQHADHAHEGTGTDQALGEGEHRASDIVGQPGASVGDVVRCPVSGHVFTVDADTAHHEHDGGLVYFCTPECMRQFARDPGAFSAALGGQPSAEPIVLDAEGTRFDPPVAKSEIPVGAWYCDMGTVHYARSVEGDGRCPRCGMRLVH